MAAQPDFRPPTLAEFVENTSNWTLAKWQVMLCEILQRMATEQGLRLLIHGPPQFGKSWIVSKRLPAWLLGLDNTRRIGIACFNETHASEQTGYVRDLIEGEDFRAMFDDPGTRVKKGLRAQVKKWQTFARAAEPDGQASCVALGMNSGVVGKGFTDVIIDDPYASPEEADSVAINERTDRWWTQGMSGRIDSTTNVVMMFHRYHENDIVARRLKDGGWTYVRFPLEADENEDGSDPTGRQPGELLSDLRSREWVEAIKKDRQLFLSQFQGVPSRPEGTLIKAEWFDNRYKYAPKMKMYVRGWDIAFSKDEGNLTVGTLIGIDWDGSVYLIDVITTQDEGPQVTQLIKDVAETDLPGTVCAVEKALASLSIVQEIEQWVTSKPIAFVAVDVPKTVSKYARMQAWLARSKRGMVRLPEDAPWVDDWIFEATRYNARKNDADDRLDSMTTAFEAAFLDPNQIEEPPEIIAAGSYRHYEILEQAYTEGYQGGLEWFERD